MHEAPTRKMTVTVYENTTRSRNSTPDFFLLLSACRDFDVKPRRDNSTPTYSHSS